MATSIKEIYNAIITEKETMNSLQDLGHNGDNVDILLVDIDSGSKVARWRLWAYVTAVVIHFHERFFDLHKEEVEAKIIAKPGKDEWLAQEVTKFQFGDALVFNADGSYSYALIDADKQIIKRVAVTRSVGQTVIKVAKENEGSPVELTSEELSAFQGFLNSGIQYAGTNVVAVSLPSDKIKIDLTVYYDAIIPVATIQANVEAAINSYLSNLEFDGTFRVSRLMDYIQAVPGVSDYSINTIEAKPDGGAYAILQRAVNPSSGYLEIDPAFLLENTITYAAE